MDPAAIVQKAPNTPISSQAMNAIANVRTAGEIALDFPWDITSPEGIIAFFGARMQDTDKDLKKLMYSQQARNAASTAMKDMKNLLDSKVGDSGRLEPGTPDYEEFKRLATEIEGSLGSSADEKALKASIDSALAPGHYDKDFNTKKDAAALTEFKAQHPDAKMTPKGFADDGITPIVTMTTENAAKAVDAGTAKALGGQITSMTDNYQTANQIDMISVQNLVNQISQITSLASNIVHSFNEAAMAPIGNTK